jgi:hypothetical protein
MSENHKKYLIYAIGVTGLSTLGYLVYRLIFKKKNIEEKENKNNTTNNNLKLNRLQSEVKESNNEKEKSTEKNKGNNNENTNKPQIIEIYSFSEILKKIVNHSFEQIYIFSDLLRQNFNQEGKFIGTEMGFNRNINEVQSEMIQKLQLENTRIIMSFGINPSSYNQTLTHYLEKNQL